VSGVGEGSGSSVGCGLGEGSGLSVGSAVGLGSISWLEGVGRLVWAGVLAFGCGFGLCTVFGLELGKWLTPRSTVPARSLQIAGFGLPVAAVAVNATPAAAIATRAGAKRHARLRPFTAPIR
jgi:hypothetical protein